ncbi:hypothetical protein Pla144_47200 [Bythopirellula polymerisocia]|uniref:Uncharacterized protein n=1 Tax=Bythopirellula polymerisocia TaxID=2528003 RepID=A0A5C6C9P1_9BACT|nr:hypothetical protein Pla144_47200 [Bythopirellula polymerisocia]
MLFRPTESRSLVLYFQAVLRISIHGSAIIRTRYDFSKILSDAVSKLYVGALLFFDKSSRYMLTTLLYKSRGSSPLFWIRSISE